MGFSIAEAGQATGLAFYAESGAFNSADGMVIGFKHKFLIAVGVRGEDSQVAILARFKSVADHDAMLKAIKDVPAVKAMYTFCDMKFSDPQTLFWTFGQPLRFNPDAFAAAIEGLVQTMSIFAQPFDPERCEGEGCNTPINSLTLANGIPNLMCDACKLRVIQDVAGQRAAYERRKPNIFRAILYGGGAALAGGVVAGLLMSFDASDNSYHPKLFVALTFVLALFVSWSVTKGVRKVNYIACALAAFLTLLSKVVADVIFFSNFLARADKVPVDLPLILGVLNSLWPIKWDFGPIVALFDVAAIGFTLAICYGMRPKFQLIYKTVPLPGRSQATAGGNA